MSAKSRATQHRHWAVNAIVAAMQSASSVDQETLFMIVGSIWRGQEGRPHPRPCV